MPKLLLGCLLAALPYTSFAAQPIVAMRCNACTAAQYEHKAFMAGSGKKYIYDFANNVLVGYQVTREPAGGGTYTYEVDPLALDPEYLAYFADERTYFLAHGTFQKDQVLHNEQPGTTPGAGGSVFPHFVTDSATNAYGHDLGSYLMQHDALVNLTGNSIVQNDGDPKKVTIVVKFKDGRATFVVDESSQDAKYVDGTAEDSQGNPIPTSIGQARGPYGFPLGGDPSKPENDFHNYLDARFPGGHWACGTVTVVGENFRTCTWVHPN